MNRTRPTLDGLDPGRIGLDLPWMVWTLLLAKVSLWEKALSWSWDWLTSATRAAKAAPNLRRDEVIQRVSHHNPPLPR